MACCPPENPLNGNGGLTEGGRLNRQMMICAKANIGKPMPVQGNDCLPCPIRQTTQANWTPTENSYLASKLINCFVPNSGRLTQERAKALLAVNGRQQLVTEGMKTQKLIQTTIECSVDPADPSARFSMFNPPLIPVVCPPLPPPPAPPLRPCPLTKNEKMTVMR